MKSSKWGVLASFFASLCCVGPLVAVSLGLGGVGLAAFFGKYHWFWMALAAAMLTAGWIRYRRESKHACADGCDLAGGRRTRNVLLTASIVLAFFAAVNAKTYIARSATPGADSTAAGETAVIQVEGMVCYTCEIALKSAVKSLPGILAVDANANEKRATVRFDPKLTTRPEIEAKINETGYRVTSESVTSP